MPTIGYVRVSTEDQAKEGVVLGQSEIQDRGILPIEGFGIARSH